MPKKIEVRIADIKAGDKFINEGSGWIATGDAAANHFSGELMLCVPVKFVPDGGLGHRYWDHGTLKTLEVERGEG